MQISIMDDDDEVQIKHKRADDDVRAQPRYRYNKPKKSMNANVLAEGEMCILFLYIIFRN
jgi:hypothetical protein